jgi:hypothetical protein
MTVYVLGAGASKHVGYPLSSTMGSEILSWMLSHERYQDTADSIREIFGASPNIEDMVTELDRIIKSLEGAEELEYRLKRSIAAQIRSKLGEVLPQWFSEIHTNPAFAYQQFAEAIVQPGDVIITFNYDDSLERELKRSGKWDVSQGYGFPIGQQAPPKSSVLVLKPHGSMNWLVSIFGGMQSGAFAIGDGGALGNLPCIATDFLKYLGYADMPGTFPGGGGFPSLILPSQDKLFHFATSFGLEHKSFFDALWAQASAALKRAEKVVLCGYSLQRVDERACDLLLKAPRKSSRIVIVSGSDGTRITNTFRDAGFQNIECYDSGFFETWVSESVKASEVEGLMTKENHQDREHV